MKRDDIKIEILDWSQPFVLCKRQRLMGGVEPYTYTHKKMAFEDYVCRATGFREKTVFQV